MQGLSYAMNQKLYRQHLVIGPTVKHLRGHVETPPKKALVFSFHGLPGTGKNFVSSMIAEHMYAKECQYVHYFSATKDFIHEGKLEEYQYIIKQRIVAAVQACPQSLFIFDEMDKMPSGIMDVVKPYLEFNQPVDGTDYRHSVFLFLSFDRLPGIYSNMGEYNIIMVAFFEIPDALKNSDLVRSSLISAYIPFLPLERRHMEKCIIDGLFAKGYYQYGIQIDHDLVKQIFYFPKDTQLFSTTGCKRVATVKHLRGHVETHPKRPLVLSFHGLSGTGKNFVSSLIANDM
ncbi:LOW QUALITY PROTEIN: TOR1B-like protein [Mya arenaria]|uniref:TOR1B-like protein n=1 Tax=Mya arenaria TaxID=6604 RepID=A0ABY7DJQ8_MYAAR|nr:LOW QUALITY PROTEIN: TOR1B-like protein [Mya arenaria]